MARYSRHIEIRYVERNRVLPEEENPCPNCGSERCHYSVKVGDVVEPHGGLKIKLMDKAGFVKVRSCGCCTQSVPTKLVMR